METMERITLVSGSPRRLDLLQAAQFDVEVIKPRSDESVPEGPLGEAITEVARQKLESVSIGDALALAADTVVEFEGRILGKPADREDACRMLEELSGNEHRVITGFVVQAQGRQVAQSIVTRVRFRSLKENEIAHYLAKGDMYDKAGAYGIQGDGGALVDVVHGSYTNVIGLPLREVLDAIETLNA
jgi:septum formation protein